jgi:hypothetical protein
MTLFFKTSRLQRPFFPHLLFLLTLTAALQGCGGETPSASPPWTPFHAGETRASCPNADLAGYKTLVHVAASGADSDSCGDKPASACASIAKGVDRCSVAGCAVLVQHGLYPTTASINLRDAVSIHGSCRFGDEPERNYRTVVAASPAPGMPAIDASGINSATALTGLVVLGKNESAAGEASIAMRVRASKGLIMNGMTLVAGRGGDGAAGIGSNGGPGGAGGTPDNPFQVGAGGQACPASPPSSGGKGGMGRALNQFTIGNCPFDCQCLATAPSQQAADLAGQDAGRARGGASGGTGGFGGNCIGHPNLTPGDGGPGAQGEIGDCSAAGGTAAADSAGRFVGGRWLAALGGQGGAGGTGSGGGGGGAGGFSTYSPIGGNVESYPGFPGSGGGGGGCGGMGGKGGQQGGASIPLVLIDASIAGLSAGSSLIPGPGGRGGGGGAGAPGGIGGTGGKPYNGSKVQRSYVFGGNAFMPGAGAAGADGGFGGASAGGAGGNGGPSFGIALVGNAPDPGHDAMYSGTPGLAGNRGAGSTNPVAPNNINSGCRSADGEGGLPAGNAPVARFEEQS